MGIGKKRYVRDFHVNEELQRRVRLYYTRDHLTGQEIGDIIGVSPRSVARWLKFLGISTQDGEHVRTTCSVCGKPVDVLRGRWRKTQLIHCSSECYYARRANPNYVRSPRGCKAARQVVVDAGFPLLKGHVVHHHDGDNRNNAVENLAVFESQRDHMRHHHGTPGLAIWDGRRQADTSLLECQSPQKP